jgi:hypothetical protein
VIRALCVIFIYVDKSRAVFFDVSIIITILSISCQVTIDFWLEIVYHTLEKGRKVTRLNKLKRLIRDRQAAYKRQTGKHLSQVSMAVEMGIDPATLSEYMNDKVGSINWEVWEKLSDYFGVPGHEIFDIAPKQVREPTE